MESKVTPTLKIFWLKNRNMIQTVSFAIHWTTSHHYEIKYQLWQKVKNESNELHQLGQVKIEEKSMTKSKFQLSITNVCYNCVNFSFLLQKAQVTIASLFLLWQKRDLDFEKTFGTNAA